MGRFSEFGLYDIPLILPLFKAYLNMFLADYSTVRCYDVVSSPLPTVPSYKDKLTTYYETGVLVFPKTRRVLLVIPDSSKTIASILHPSVPSPPLLLAWHSTPPYNTQ